MREKLKVLLFALCTSLVTLAIGQEGSNATKTSNAIAIDKQYVKEIDALAKMSATVNAFKYILELEPETKQDLITLNEIPAPPFKEEKRGEKYFEMLQKAGVDSIWIDEVGNVIALRKGKSGKKTVVIEAHLDTVFPEGTDVTVKQKGDTLYAPGIGDDTRGLAVVLTILKAMNKASIKTESDVLFIGTVGEEGLGDLRGVKHLFSSKGPKIDSYIGIEPGLEDITHRGLGSVRYRITYKGPGGHSSVSFGLVNPHSALGKAIYYYTADADKFTRENGVPVTYNVGVIGGGTSVNSIPFESWMEIDMRSESPERLQRIDSLLQAAVQRALKEENAIKRHGVDLTVEVKSIGNRPSGTMAPAVPIIQRALAATKFFNAEPRLHAGSANSNIPISKGIPSLTLGSGGLTGGNHSFSEWWLNDNGFVAIQRNLLTLLAEAGVAK